MDRGGVSAGLRSPSSFRLRGRVCASMVLLSRFLRLVLGIFVAVAAFGSAGAGAAPTSLTLVFDGAHVPDASLPAGLNHKGRFTAGPPLCASGTAQDVQDVELEPLTVLRSHTCDDGSGSFTALIPAAVNEHSGIGSWKIVAGTGRYETLRGVGTYVGKLVSGDPQNFLTIVFQTTWRGVVDFDAVPPTLTATARAKKLRRPPRTYTIRTAIDGHEPNISYSVDIRAGKRYLALKTGTSSSGTLTVNLKIRAPRKTGNVSVIVTAGDAVGNESTTTLVVKVK